MDEWQTVYTLIRRHILGRRCLLKTVSSNTKGKHGSINNIQSTLVISNSKGLTETLQDIRTSTYQSWKSEENNKLNNHI